MRTNIDKTALIDGQEVLVRDPEEAINKINVTNKFQKIAFILLTICYTCTGSFFPNSFIFLEKDPPITCMRIVDGQMKNQTCTRREVRELNSDIQSFEFHFIEDTSYSWTNDFKLTCEYEFVIASLISVFFIGSLISSLIASSLSDYFGRAKVIKISMYVRIIFIVLPLAQRNLTILLFSLFCLGFLNSMHSTIPYILLSEYLGKDERDHYLTLMFMFESFSGIVATAFFILIQNWVVFYVLNLLYGLGFVIFSYMLYESPRFLYTHKNYEEARDVLKKMAKVNLNKEINFKFQKEYVVDQNLKKLMKTTQVEDLSILEIFKTQKYKLYIMILPFIWFLNAFAFYAINFMIKYIKGNIYYFNVIIFISEAVSYYLSNNIILKLGKRNTMIFSFIISGISFIIFYFIENSGDFIWITIITFLAKFGASVVLNVSSIYTNESFPTYISGRATAVCSFLGKFGGIIAPFIVEMTPVTGIISGIASFIAAGVLIPLENRKKKVQFTDDKETIENN